MTTEDGNNLGNNKGSDENGKEHKNKWLERAFLGRHADRILADAPCPVLVVREEETDLIYESDQA